MSLAKIIRFGGAKPTDPTYPPSMPTVGAVDAPVAKPAVAPSRQFFKTAKGPAKPVAPTIKVGGGFGSAVRRLIAR